MGEVPDDWKKVNVTPIIKKGKKKDPVNNVNIFVRRNTTGKLKKESTNMLYHAFF